MKTVQSGRSHELALTFERLHDSSVYPVKTSRGIGLEIIEPVGLSWLDGSPVAFWVMASEIGHSPVLSNRPLKGKPQLHTETLTYNHDHIAGRVGESLFYPVTSDGVVDLMDPEGGVDAYRLLVTRNIGDLAIVAPTNNEQTEPEEHPGKKTA